MRVFGVEGAGGEFGLEGSELGLVCFEVVLVEVVLLEGDRAAVVVEVLVGDGDVACHRVRGRDEEVEAELDLEVHGAVDARRHEAAHQQQCEHVRDPRVYDLVEDAAEERREAVGLFLLLAQAAAHAEAVALVALLALRVE